MPKFADVAKGHAARKPIRLPFLKDAKGEPVFGDLVTLPGELEGEVNAFARAYSLAKKGTGLPEDPNYELGVMAKTVSLALLDADVQDKSEPMFASPEEVLSANELGRDGIAYIYQQQKAWQHEIAPGLEGKSPAEFIAIAAEVSGTQDPSPFCALKPNSQLSFVLFLSNLYCNSQIHKLLSGSTYESAGTSTSESTSAARSEVP